MIKKNIDSRDIEYYLDNKLAIKDLMKIYDLSERTIYRKIENYKHDKLRGASINSNESKRWTKREIEIIKNNYSYGDQEYLLKSLPGRTWRAISTKAQRLKIKNSSRRKWTDKEIKSLKDSYDKKSWPELIKIFDRTKMSIKRKAEKLGLNRDSDIAWTKEEDNLLKKVYKTEKLDNIKKLFPDRSESSILSHCRYLGLTGRIIGQLKYKIKDIKETLSEEDYKLIDFEDIGGYIRTKSKIRISCPNKKHDPYLVTFNDYLNGVRCRKCYLDSMWGSGNPRYIEGMEEEERIIKRITPEYNEFMRKVYARFRGHCCLTNIKGQGETHVHHLYSFIDNRGLIYEANNAIILKAELHYLFHSEFGFGNNSPQQILKFIKKYKSNNYNDKLQKYLQPQKTNYDEIINFVENSIKLK
jgi:hypothetical protein